ncbi:MAG TPA: hypothetical protein PLF63_01750, partial [Rubrivivax sp.]|nr:hypothetical protein [Rubrivivax sp.]
MASAAGWSLLGFGAFGALSGVVGLLRWPRQDALAMWWFAFGLVGSEFTAAMIPLGLLGAASLAGLGALETLPGRVGAVLTLLGLAAMAVSQKRAWGDKAPLEQTLQQALGADYRARILPERADTLR